MFPVPGLFLVQNKELCLKILSIITSSFPLLFSCAPSTAVCVYSPKMQPRARIVPEVQCVHVLLWMRDGRVVPLFLQVLRAFQQALSGRCGEVKALAKTNSKMSCTISQCLWLLGCLLKCQLFLQNGRFCLENIQMPFHFGPCETF